MKMIEDCQKLARLFLLLGLVISTSLVTNAQITILESDMPQESDTVRSSSGLNLDFIDYTETGEDYVWDFSQLTSITQGVDTFLSPSSMPFVYKYIFGSSSNVAVRSVQDAPIPGFPLTDMYNFFDNKPDNYRAIGLGVSISGIPIPLKYDNPDLVYNFPMEYQDNWTSQAHIAQGIFGIGYLRMTRNHSDTVDGWGTLLTPYGSFEVLRLKSVVDEYDSIYVDSLNTGIPINRNYTVFQWLGKEQKIPLLQITSSLGGVVVDYIDSVRVDVDGIGTTPFVANNEFKAFPNPTANKMFVQFDLLDSQNIDVKLIDLQGKEVLLIFSGYKQQGKTKLEIDLREMNIPPGLYLLQLQSGNTSIIQKVVYNP